MKLEPPGTRAEELADGLRESGRGVGDQGSAVFGRRAPARQRRGDDREAMPHHVKHLHLHPGTEADRCDSQRRAAERTSELPLGDAPQPVDIRAAKAPPFPPAEHLHAGSRVALQHRREDVGKKPGQGIAVRRVIDRTEEGDRFTLERGELCRQIGKRDVEALDPHDPARLVGLPVEGRQRQHGSKPRTDPLHEGPHMGGAVVEPCPPGERRLLAGLEIDRDVIGIVEDETRLRLEPRQERSDGVILGDDPPVPPLRQDAFEQGPGPAARFVEHRPRGRGELAAQRVAEPVPDPPGESAGVIGIGDEYVPERTGPFGGLRLLPARHPQTEEVDGVVVLKAGDEPR